MLEQLGSERFRNKILDWLMEQELHWKKEALFKYGNKIVVADVIFGEADDPILLGAFTLEALGLALNQIKRELIELPMIL